MSKDELKPVQWAFEDLWDRIANAFRKLLRRNKRCHHRFNEKELYICGTNPKCIHCDKPLFSIPVDEL